METTPRKIETRPPRVIVAIVEGLIPYPHREYALGDLCQGYVSLLRFIAQAAAWVLCTIATQVRRSFNIRLSAAEACALIIAFSGASFSFALGVVLGVALGALILRDAYRYPVQGTPQDAGVDALVALTLLVFSQALFGVILPAAIMIRAAALTLLTVSTVRVIFRRAPGRRQPSRPSYRLTRNMNVLWMIAALAIAMTSPDTVPTLMAHQSFFFVFLPIAVFAIAFRLNQNALDGTLRKDGIVSVFQDPNRRELTRKRDSLWGHDANAAEILAFVLLALPLCIAPFSSNVDWLSVGTNSAAFLALSVLWVYIRKANQKTARALQEEIDALNKSSKK